MTKTKKILGIVLAIMILTLAMAISVFAQDTETGTLTNAYTSGSGYWGECGGSADESFGFKLYNDDTYMGSTFLNNIDGIIDGDVYVSWSIKLDAESNTDNYWTMKWDVAPTIAMQPNRVEQWVDGVKVAEAVVEPNWSDRIFKVTAAVTDADGKILSYVNGTKTYTLADAFKNGGNITVLDNVVVDDTLEIPSGVALTLDLNGKSISQTKAQTGNYQMILNDGDFTIVDGVGGGKLSYTDTLGGNFISNTITNRGTLTLVSGRVENMSSSAVAEVGFPYAIDTSIWGKASEVVINIEGGEVYCESYSALRLRADSETKPVNINVTGGKIYGRIEVQNPTSNKATVGKLTISGGEVDNNNSSKAIMIFGGGGTAENMEVEITGGTIKGAIGYSSYFPIENFNENVISGGTFTEDVSDFCVDGFEVSENEDGTFGVAEISYAAQIGDVKYATFADALTAASAMTGDVVVEILDQKVTLNTSLSGNYTSIKFVGNGENAEIYLDIQGFITAQGKNVAFEDLKLSKVYGGFIADAAYMNYAFGVYHVNSVSYTNCVFLNGAYAASGDVTFTGCKFYRSHDKYAIWTYGTANIVVDDCVFADYRGIKLYSSTTALTVKNSDFSNATDKPAIVLTYGASVTLDNNEYPTSGVFELDLDGAPNGTPVTSDVLPTCVNDNGVCGVLVDGEIYTTVAQAAEVAKEGSKVTLLHDSTETVELAEGVILEKGDFTADGVTVKKGLQGSGTEEDPFLITSLDDLKLFRDDVNAGNNTYDNQFIVLTVSIDLNNEEWTPIGNITNKFLGTFNGQENTISNLNVNISANHAGLFGYASVIKNVNIVNAKVSGYVCVGALVGELENSVGTVDNCHVSGNIQITGENSVGGLAGKGYANIKNSSVIGDGVNTSFVLGVNNGHEEGDNIGGIIGHLGEGNTLGVASSTAKNIKIAGTRKVGGIVGTTTRANDYVGNSVDNLVIECTATEEYANDNATTTTIGGIIGNYFGTATSGGILKDSTVSNITFNVGYAKSAGVLAGGDRNNNGGAPIGVDTTTGNVVDFATVTGATNTYLMPVAAEVNGQKFESVADALAYAKEQGIVDLVITIIGENTKETADSFDLGYAEIFDSVVIKQDNNGKAYYFNVLYTGERTNNGTFVFDGVNLIVTEQYMFEGNVKLTNNSVVKSTTESNCFLYYSTTIVEAGSKLVGVIDDFRGGDLIIDGGLTDGSFSTIPGLQDAIVHIRWNGDSLTLQNGAYAKINSADEIGSVTIYANTSLNVNKSKLEAVQYITNDGTINIDINSIIKTGKITGAGVINVDITGLTGSVLVIDADMSEFTGEINIVGTGAASYAITEDGLVVTVAEYVAEVNGTKYATLEDAVAYLKANGGTIKLLSDVGGSMTFNDKTGEFATKNPITVDLNGFTITSAESTLWVSDGYVVTVKDSSEAKTGKIATTTNGEVVGIARNGKVIFESGTVEGIAFGVYIYDTNDTDKEVFIMNGGTITVPNGGIAFGISSGKAIINNGKVLCNKYQGGSGWNSVVYDVTATLTITGGEFLGTIGNWGTIAISGGTFSYCGGSDDGFNNDHLAAGYTTKTNDDGSITVVKLPASAKIGDVEYATIVDALKAAQNGDTIVLLADCTVTEVVELRDISITIVGEYTLTSDGKIQVYGETTLNITSTVSGDINLMEGAIIKDSNVNGNGYIAGNVTFRGKNTFSMISDYGNYYSKETPSMWTVEKGGSLTLTSTERYGLGYGDKVTVFGNIVDALNARDTLVDSDIAINMYGGLVGMTNSAFVDAENSFVAKDAYIIFGVEGDKSFGNKIDYYGNYVFTFDNSVVTANAFKFYEDYGSSIVTFTNSDLLVNGIFMTNDASSKFTFTNCVIVSKAENNGTNDRNINSGEIILVGTSLTYNAKFTNNGTIKLDVNSCLTAPAIDGTGKFVIDVTGLTTATTLIKADMSDFKGTIEVINGNADYDIVGNGVVVTPCVAQIGDVKYATLAEAIAALKDGDTLTILAGEISEGSIKFPASLANVTIKGEDGAILKDMTLTAHDGSNISYTGITFDNITFNNSNILFSGYRASAVYKDWTIKNCTFTNVARGNAAISFNLNTTEAMENFTFTGNTIDGVTGGNYSGLVLRASKGTVVITNNNIKNAVWNAIQVLYSTGKLTIENNTLASGASEGVLNLNGVTATELSIKNNKFILNPGQPGICYLTAGDVSENYWGGEAPANLPEGVTCESYYADEALTKLVTMMPEIPTATVAPIINPNILFGLTFNADAITEEQLEYFGDWFADFTIVFNKDMVLNADGTGDGWLSGQYDEFGEGWVNVPFEDLVIEAGKTYKVMELAAQIMGKPDLKLTYADVVEFVKEFNCGVYLSDEFIAENPDFSVEIGLSVFNPADETIEIKAPCKDAEGNAMQTVFTEEDIQRAIVSVTTTLEDGKTETTYFASLADAINALKAGDKLTIVEDIEITEGYVIDKSVTIDLNGKTVALKNSDESVNCIFNIVGNDVVVAITNGTLTVEYGQVIYTGKTGEDDGAVSSNPTISLDKVTLTGADYGITIAGNSIVNINADTTITGAVEAVRVFDNANATIVAGAKVTCTTEGKSAIMAYGNATVAISGGIFTGEIVETENATVELTGGTYTTNVSDLCADGYTVVDNGDGTVSVVNMPKAPTATVAPIINPNILFGLTFNADSITEEQLEFFGDWFADFTIVFNKDMVLNADGTGDGWLSGQYDEFGEGWVNVPFEDLVIEAGKTYKVMELAAQIMGKPDLKLTYADVVEFVKEFNCGVYLSDEFIAENPDFSVEIGLSVFNPADETIEIKAPCKDAEGNAMQTVFTEEDIQRAIVSVTTTLEDGKTETTYFTSLADAIDAAKAGDVITLLSDIALTETLTVADGKVITLDLNGYVVSYEDASGVGTYLIKNYGDLTIKSSKDGGKITFVSTTPDTSFGYATSTIGNAGNLVVESGIIENTTNGGASYAIDTIWYTKDVSLTINGGEIKAVKIAVRQVPFSSTYKYVVNVNGGTLTGATAGLQTHYTSANANLAEVNISGGTFNGTYAYYTSYSSNNGHEGTTINITGGTFNGYLYIYNGKAGSADYDFAGLTIEGGTFNNYVYVYTKDSEGGYVYAPAIKGGTFATPVSLDNCAIGFVPTENSDGTYGVTRVEIAWKNASLSIKSELQMNFYLETISIIDGIDYYARVIKHHDTGCNNHAECEIIYIPLKNWTDMGDGRTRITVNGIAAKDMACRVEIQIFVGEMPEDTKVPAGTYADGMPAAEGSQIASTKGIMSVRSYCEALFNKTDADSVAHKPLLANLLLYGEAAQKYFGHYVGTEDAPVYVTNGIKDIVDSYATEPTAVANVSKWLGGNAEFFKQYSLSLEDTTYLNFYFRNLDAQSIATQLGVDASTIDLTKLSANAQFTHNSTDEHNSTYVFTTDENATGNVFLYNAEKGEAFITIDDLAAADLGKIVTVTLTYDGTTLAQFSTNATSYCAIVKANKGNEKYPEFTEELDHLGDRIVALAQEAEKVFAPANVAEENN